MYKSILIIVLVGVFACSCGMKESNKELVIDTNLFQEHQVHDFVDSVRLPKLPHALLDLYSDSLRTCIKTGQLALFLYNKNFDLENMYVTDHLTLSIRTELIKNIKNSAYIKILMANDPHSLLKERLSVSVITKTPFADGIPNIHMSTYELLNQRLKEIKKSSHR
ncbi:hypothetical protein QNI16_05480 [Cytophagaceae bacterium YF14B1]|uniref:Lipoprotein n=1 Tax=Xanthocytophaga flava TaxID=3048013 RepID=A0AAE3U7A7_9BACT|nr:hypothetical protein [Xanthocytophaga flavus]MDJ1479928.1 hypothetical protein [Xanthocytophaga flavus]